MGLRRCHGQTHLAQQYAGVLLLTIRAEMSAGGGRSLPEAQPLPAARRARCKRPALPGLCANRRAYRVRPAVQDAVGFAVELFHSAGESRSREGAIGDGASPCGIAEGIGIGTAAGQKRSAAACVRPARAEGRVSKAAVKSVLGQLIGQIDALPPDQRNAFCSDRANVSGELPRAFRAAALFVFRYGLFLSRARNDRSHRSRMRACRCLRMGDSFSIRCLHWYGRLFRSQSPVSMPMVTLQHADFFLQAHVV